MSDLPIPRKLLVIGALVVPLVARLCLAAPIQPPSKEGQNSAEQIEKYIRNIETYQSHGQFDSSMIVMREAIPLAQRKGLRQYYSDLYRFLGYYYKANNEVEKSIRTYKKAYYWCIKNNQKEKANWLTYRLASVYVDRCLIIQKPNNFKIALKQIHRNLNLPNSFQTPYNQICNYGLLVYIYQIYNNDSLYYHYISRVISLSRTRTNSPKEKFFLLVDEFGLNLWKGEIEKADELFQEILHLEERRDFSFVHSLYLIEMLNGYIKFGYYDKAEMNAFFIQQNPSIMAVLGESDRMNLFYCLTAIDIHNKDFTQARINHEKCKSYIKKELFSSIKLKILQNELLLLEYEKKYREALNLQKEIAEAENNQYKNQAIFELAASQERFELQNATLELNNQLAIQKLENKNKERNLVQARQIQWLTLSILLLLIAVMSLFIWQYNKIKMQSTELVALNKQQNSIFGIIGHDLRSPVANLQNFLRIASLSRNHRQIISVLPELESRISTLYNTLDNLLNWSLAQMDGVQVTIQKVDLNDCVMDVLELLRPQSEKKSISILTNVNPKWVLANEQLVEVILRNLLDNAIKFTPKMGYIKLSSVQDGPFLVLNIQDSGNGFSPQILSRGITNLTTSTGTEGELGTGLGLKLCSDLLKKLGGDLHIISHLNQGAMVRMRLPGYFKENEPFDQQVAPQSGSSSRNKSKNHSLQKSNSRLRK